MKKDWTLLVFNILLLGLVAFGLPDVPLWLGFYIGFATLLTVIWLAAYLVNSVGNAVNKALNQPIVAIGLLPILAGFWLRGLIAAPLHDLPNLWLYIPFALMWIPVLVFVLFLYERRGLSTRIASVLFQGGAMVIFTWVLLEVALRFGYGNLPPEYKDQVASVSEGALIPRGQRAFALFDLYPIEGRSFENVQAPANLVGDLYTHTCAEPLADDPTPLITEIEFVQYDALGFREQPLTLSDDPDLVVLGDSFSAAPFINPQYWENLTDNTLALPVVGSGTLEQALVMNAFVVEMGKKPDVVVLQYFEGNDMRGNWWFTVKLNEQRSQRDRLDSYAPYQLTLTYQLVAWLTSPPAPEEEPEDLQLRSNHNVGRGVARYAPTRLTAWQPPTDCPYPLVDEYGHQLAFLPQYISMGTLSQEALTFSQSFEFTKQGLLDIKAMADDIGAELVLLYIPTKIHVHLEGLPDEELFRLGDDLQAFTTYDNAFFEVDNRITDPADIVRLLRENIDVQRDAIAQIAEENDILFLDVTPRYKEAVQNGNPVYWWADTHYNQLGNDIAREMLVEFLREHNLLVDKLNP